MRIALAQLRAGTDPASNITAVEKYVAEAGAAGVSVVVFPEATMRDFGRPDDDLRADAETLDGRFVSSLRTLAREHGTAVVAGMFEPADATRVYNTLVVVGPTGEVVATYRKLHLFDAFGARESDRIAPGDQGPVVVDLDGFRLGLMTCYDLRFPELARALVDDGAETLVIPAAWYQGPMKEHHWLTLATARAIENTSWVAAACQAGPTYTGRSVLIDPFGMVVASTGDQEALVVGDVDRDRLADARRRVPCLANRRFDVRLRA